MKKIKIKIEVGGKTIKFIKE